MICSVARFISFHVLLKMEYWLLIFSLPAYFSYLYCTVTVVAVVSPPPPAPLKLHLSISLLWLCFAGPTQFRFDNYMYIHVLPISFFFFFCFMPLWLKSYFPLCIRVMFSVVYNSLKLKIRIRHKSDYVDASDLNYENPKYFALNKYLISAVNESLGMFASQVFTPFQSEENLYYCSNLKHPVRPIYALPLLLYTC